jgi:hypothetical protein
MVVSAELVADVTAMNKELVCLVCAARIILYLFEAPVFSFQRPTHSPYNIIVLSFRKLLD